MEMIAQIDMNFNWKIGKINLNELAYRVDKLIPNIAVQLMEHLIHAYQEEIVSRLKPGYRSSARAGLGRHTRKGNIKTLCRGRTVRRRGYRWHHRGIKSKYGTLWIRLQIVECLKCGKQYSPLLEALGIEPYQRHDDVIEEAVLEAVIDTNYRRLIEGHNIDISLGGVHNYIAGSEIQELVSNEVKLDRYDAVMADGTGVKKKGGKRGELRVLVGITGKGRLEPLGSWVDTSWKTIESHIRKRIRSPVKDPPLLLYDGEHGLDEFLAGIVRAPQRCTWHAPRGLYHAMWEDGFSKTDAKPHQKKLIKIIGIEIPEGDYEQLDAEAIEAVREKYSNAKKELNDLITVLHKKGCPSAVEYLRNLTKGLYHQVEMWLSTGIIVPTTISRLERLFRELGRRLKKIAWGWSDRIAAKLSNIIMIKKYQPDLWKKYWLKKMGIDGNFHIRIDQIKIMPCLNF